MLVPDDLKIRYLSRRDEDLKLLRSSLATNDFSVASRVGHQVKGNAVTFEFPQLAALGDELEKAAKFQDKRAVELIVQKLESMIHQEKTTYLN